jgi:hypothetical protein
MTSSRQKLRDVLGFLDELRPLIGTKDAELWTAVWAKALEAAKAAAKEYLESADA